jgi:hypothetical protein
MDTVIQFLVRVVMFAAGMLLALGLLMLGLVLLALWGLRSLWARATGQAFSPFVMRMDPRTGFMRMYRRGAEAARTQRPTTEGGSHMRASGRLHRLHEVTDVQPKAVREA